VITSPIPSPLLTPKLTPSVRISWQGNDPDGVFNSKPIKYKYTLLTPSSVFPLAKAVRSPDSLRIFYAPNFVGWDSTSGETTTVQLTNLTPDQEYLFVVVGFDEAGAYSPIMSLSSNMLRFKVGFGGSLGSTIIVFNEFFNYLWRPNYCPCPSTEVFIEVPAGDSTTMTGKVTFNWVAIPPTGANLKAFRWAVDLVNGDVTDDTPRSNELTDLKHWSSPSLNVTSATLGPYEGTVFPAPPEEHKLYIEAQDDVGLKSLAIIRFQVIRPNMQPGRILVVKDTRLRVDGQQRTATCVQAPKGPWPTTAELDTFLFARGGVPWRPIRDAANGCPEGYPVGTQTTPGLFSAYHVDTIGTRIQKPDLTVRLLKLSLYEFVVWLVDGRGATSDEDGTSLISPQTALRYMCSPGKFNTLAAYIKMGGKAWCAGGGVGFASNIPWNLPENDQPTITFSSLSQRPDLNPGRFMYDIAHWQSAYRSPADPATFTRFGGRFDQRPDPDPNHYSRFSSELPPYIDIRSPQSVPTLPPNRNNRGDFYPQSTPVEYLAVENYIQENVSPTPTRDSVVSTLDTIYTASGGGLPYPNENPYNASMTYYHGPSVPQGFIFSGFSLWDAPKPVCQAVVDFVMKRMWGVHPSPMPSSRIAGRESVSRPPALQGTGIGRGSSAGSAAPGGIRRSPPARGTLRRGAAGAAGE
jgi:hypothetical protein